MLSSITTLERELSFGTSLLCAPSIFSLSGLDRGASRCFLPPSPALIQVNSFRPDQIEGSSLSFFECFQFLVLQTAYVLPVIYFSSYIFHILCLREYPSPPISLLTSAIDSHSDPTAITFEAYLSGPGRTESYCAPSPIPPLSSAVGPSALQNSSV